MVDKFDKNIVRNIKLNLVFNKKNKDFDITYENVENFDDANTIKYFTSCSDFEPNDLYFHESCLNNFFDNLLINDLKECKTFLGIIFYDVEHYNELNSEIIKIDKDQMHFYCYNKDTNEIDEDESNFIELNKNSVFSFNFDNDDLIQENHIMIKNIRRANSLFPLVHQNENDFISFKNTVNIFLYNQFIDFLKKKSQQYN